VLAGLGYAPRIVQSSTRGHVYDARLADSGNTDEHAWDYVNGDKRVRNSRRRTGRAQSPSAATKGSLSRGNNGRQGRSKNKGVTNKKNIKRG